MHAERVDSVTKLCLYFAKWSGSACNAVSLPTPTCKNNFKHVREFFASFASFRECFTVFLMFWDAFGRVRMRLDAFGCIRMRSETNGGFCKNSDFINLFYHFSDTNITLSFLIFSDVLDNFSYLLSLVICGEPRYYD